MGDLCFKIGVRVQFIRKIVALLASSKNLKGIEAYASKVKPFSTM